MYMHSEFIGAIRARYRDAHKGNVNQLLEGLNKLASVGVLYVADDYTSNCCCCWYETVGARRYKSPPLMSGDEGCMNFCMWVGELLQALRREGVLA